MKSRLVTALNIPMPLLRALWRGRVALTTLRSTTVQRSLRIETACFSWRNVHMCARGVLDEDPLASGLAQGIELQLGALVLGGDAGMADEHGVLPKLIESLSFRERSFKGAFWDIHEPGIAYAGVEVRFVS